MVVTPAADETAAHPPLVGAGVWGAAAVGVVLRLVWVALVARVPIGLSDPFVYRSYGIAIASGSGYESIVGDPTAYFPPGYPYLLGAVYRLAGGLGVEGFPTWPVGIAQSLWWGVAIVAVGGTARILAGPRAGVLAALVLACWPNLVAYAGAVLSESAFVAAAAVAVWSLTVLVRRDAGRPSWGWLTAAAAGTATATAVRPQFLVVVLAVVLVWVVARVPGRTIVGVLAALGIGLVAVFVPWTLRNSLQLGAFVPVSTNTGDNLCIGAFPGARGGFAIAAPCQSGVTWYDGVDGELAQDRFGRSVAIDAVVDDPWRWIALIPAKLFYTYLSDDDGLDAVEGYGADPVTPSTLRSAFVVVANVAYAGIAVLGLAGLVLFLRRDRRERDPAVRAFVAATVVSLFVPVLFFGDPRFKVSASTFVAVLAGAALAAASERFGPDQAAG